MIQKGSVNKVILVGHLGDDPEVRYTPSGMATARLSIATNQSRKDADGNFTDYTEWHRVVSFGRQAEFCNEWLRKGQLVYVEGRLQTRSWEDKEGQKRWTTEIIVDQLTMLGKRAAPSESEKESKDESEVEEDEIPF